MSRLAARIAELELSAERWRERVPKKKTEEDDASFKVPLPDADSSSSPSTLTPRIAIPPPPQRQDESPTSSSSSTTSTLKTLLTQSQSNWTRRVKKDENIDLLTVGGRLRRDLGLNKEEEEDPLKEDIPKDIPLEDEEQFREKKSFKVNPKWFQSFFPDSLRRPEDPTLQPIDDIIDLEKISDSLTLTDNNIYKSRPAPPRRGHRRRRRPRNRAIEETPQTRTSPESQVKSALTSKIDFDAVKLKRMEEQEGKSGIQKRLYKLKGKSRVFPVLVAAKRASLNDGDVFVLFLEEESTRKIWGCWVFFGKYANLLERSKGEEFFHGVGGVKGGGGGVRRVSSGGVGWEEFLKELEEEEEGNQVDLNKELGEESDLAWERGVVEGWGVWRWEETEGEWVEVEEEEQWKKGEWLVGSDLTLYDFSSSPTTPPTLPERYIHYNPSTTSPSTLGESYRAALTLFQSCPSTTLKKIPFGAETIEFRLKFTTDPPRRKTKKLHNDPTTPENNKYTLNPEILQSHDEITLEGGYILRPGGTVLSGVVEDPRQITLTTPTSLTKHRITLTTISPHPPLDFHSSDCYILTFTFSLSFQTGRLKKEESPTTPTSTAPRRIHFLWLGKESSLLDRGRVSTLFSVDCSGEIELLFPKGERQIVEEEGSESAVFLWVVRGAEFRGGQGGRLVECRGRGSGFTVWREEIEEENKKIESIYEFRVIRLTQIQTYKLVDWYWWRRERRGRSFSRLEVWTSGGGGGGDGKEDDDKKKETLLVINTTDRAFRRTLVENVESLFEEEIDFVVFEKEEDDEENENNQRTRRINFHDFVEKSRLVRRLSDLPNFLLLHSMAELAFYITEDFLIETNLLLGEEVKTNDPAPKEQLTTFKNLPLWRQKLLLSKIL